MLKCSVICLLLVVAFSTFDASASIIPKSKSQKMIESIPEEDRGEFIMIQLAKGVDQLHRTDVMFLGVSDSDNYYENVREYLQDDEKFKDVKVPDDFCTNLVYWVEDNMVKFNRRPTRRDEGAVCYPSGCVDPGDVGQVCCPF